MGKNAAKEQGRSRLDASLTSPVLLNKSGVLNLVRQQLSSSPILDKKKETVEKAAEKRATEIFTFLEALRSARQDLLDDEESPFSWKIKEETDLMRVMYRPGPEGTPFHTYCVEGIVNGPTTNAVCVAWEAPSYGTWWPQFNMPVFKIVESRWVKRIRVGEDLSHIRVKVPWPLAAREVLMTEFELEHFDDDIIIVVLGTAPSDPDEVEEEIYGFSADELPPVTENAVRIDIAGGFILQKITDDQSFFRTVVNMDIKLDHIPPWVINFITRQLVGSGYKLYQKAVLSASKSTGSGKVFQQLMATEPLYKRIKSGMEIKRKSSNHKDIIPESRSNTASSSKEPEEINKVKQGVNAKQKVQPAIKIDYEVEQALQVLDKMIDIIQDWKSSQNAALENIPSTEEDIPSTNHGLENGSSLTILSRTKNEINNNGRLGWFGSSRKQQIQVRSKPKNWGKILKSVKLKKLPETR